MSVKAFIADDEVFAREELKHQLSIYSEIDIIGESDNGIDAINQIKQLKPDLLFLDIEMPGLRGIEIAEVLTSTPEYKPFIIIVTAYEDYALKAFEYDVVDYLLKPIDRKRFSTAMARVIKYSESKPEHNRITAKKGNRILLIQEEDISYVYSENTIVYIFSKGSTYSTTYRTLDDIEGDLSPKDFFRVHRSYIVNLKKVVELKQGSSGTIALKVDSVEDMEVPVARSKVKDIKSIFNV
jgi:DNA-binding LytR/AlgR family response regulator